MPGWTIPPFFLELTQFARNSATKNVITADIPRVELRMRNKKLTTPIYANGVSFRGPCGSQRLCQVWKVVIEKVDDRNAERIMRTEVLDRFVIRSLPTDFPQTSQ